MDRFSAFLSLIRGPRICDALADTNNATSVGARHDRVTGAARPEAQEKIHSVAHLVLMLIMMRALLFDGVEMLMRSAFWSSSRS